MANPRLPKAKAEVSGAAAKNPQRHASRKAPKLAAIGEPPVNMTANQKKAWALFQTELPWLNRGHRALLEVACIVRGVIVGGEVPGVTSLSMYQSLLSKLGASPVDETRVSIPDGDEGDPEDRFFGRPN